jgi:hypothetical protein
MDDPAVNNSPLRAELEPDGGYYEDDSSLID